MAVVSHSMEKFDLKMVTAVGFSTVGSSHQGITCLLEVLVSSISHKFITNYPDCVIAGNMNCKEKLSIGKNEKLMLRNHSSQTIIHYFKYLETAFDLQWPIFLTCSMV